MEEKNFKSDSYVVREAENIIEKYLRDRELSDMKKYYNLKEKYGRLKIVTIAMFVTCCFAILTNIF